MKNGSRTILLLAILLILSLSANAALLYRTLANGGDKDASADTEQAHSDESEEQVKEPLIAIVDYDTEDADRIGRYVHKAGYKSERVGKIEDLDVEKYDAIIIPGGHSVTPSMYGAERDPSTKGTNINKDRFQFAAVEMYAEAEKPVLGICRGMQLVNNVLGGTTIQDMPDGWHKLYRPVTIAEGTWMYDLLGKEADVYHFHHQCVDKLGDGLYATEWDPVSGNIEAYEHRTLPIYGLQWHPDSMDEVGVKVFAEFGKLVEQNMQKDSQDITKKEPQDIAKKAALAIKKVATQETALEESQEKSQEKPQEEPQEESQGD